MVQLLIFAVDTGDHPTDQAVNAARFRPGDVVVAVDNGHVWGAEEVGPHVKLVRAPNISVAQVAHFLGQDVPYTSFSDFHSRLRIWYFDNWQTLPAQYNGTAAALQALVKQRSQIPVDPAPQNPVAGAQPVVLG